MDFLWIPCEFHMRQSWTSYGFPIDCLWVPHRLRETMDSQWISHGFQWFPQGFPMDALWVFFGFLVDSILIIYGFSWDSLLIIYVFSLDSVRFLMESLLLPMDPLCIPCAHQMTRSWIPLDYLRICHGSPNRFHWISQGFPMYCQGIAP